MAATFKTLLITPPFTQLNTPYPATAYLKGYLNSLGGQVSQADLGIEVIHQLFSRQGLTHLFETIEQRTKRPNHKILKIKSAYIDAIDPVISFLQNKNPTLAYAIAERGYLPEGSRFDQIDDLDWAFGHMGIQDRARHMATLFLEDLADLIKVTVDPYFGFSRYAERLSLAVESFDPLHAALNKAASYTDKILISCLGKHLSSTTPDLICLSVPFPGNLYSALRIGQFIKESYPEIKVAMGGGYPNTELRSLQEARIFDYIDYITLDDGERPIEVLIEFLKGNIEQCALKRTFLLSDGKVKYINGSKLADVPFSQIGTPDYEGLPLSSYLSVIEVTNPMHRLWSDGRWNKLTMAHGCYWKKCTFCDISLDYIKNYEPVSASIICDRIEDLIEQTGETGFHFVDEAAPPALMKEVAIEILKRGLKISWWTNIRFEKRFTMDLCRLLKSSGCIAVSGGLEVASDRLLEMIKKGVTVAQVAQVSNHFTECGIMVHAYLMYGFPSQTVQETVDSLEMVRQLFELGVVQSGFWHQFAMTAHSPVGLDPAAFGAKSLLNASPVFAHNDLPHEDLEGTDHQMFSEGLRKSLFNYMHGVGFDFQLQEWFDFEIPDPTVQPHSMAMAIQNQVVTAPSDNTRIVWLHALPHFEYYEKESRRKRQKRCKIYIYSNSEEHQVIVPHQHGLWLEHLFSELGNFNRPYTIGSLSKSFTQSTNEDFNKLIKSQGWIELRKIGLVYI